MTISGSGKYLGTKYVSVFPVDALEGKFEFSVNGEFFIDGVAKYDSFL